MSSFTPREGERPSRLPTPTTHPVPWMSLMTRHQEADCLQFKYFQWWEAQPLPKTDISSVKAWLGRNFFPILNQGVFSESADFTKCWYWALVLLVFLYMLGLGVGGMNNEGVKLGQGLTTLKDILPMNSRVIRWMIDPFIQHLAYIC